MDGNLVIVESPAKAKTIQKFLGEGYTVKPSIGHIRDLQTGKLSVDINDGFKPEYIVPEGKKKIVSDLKAAANKASTVWLASDEDREGEAISWHLVETLELDPSKTKRIAFHEITKTAIKEAIEHPRQIDMNLVNAQQARRVLDRLVGFEVSPILWKKIQRGLSAGRVQSVALRLVIDREKEIMNFKSTASYRMEGTFNIDGAVVKGSLDSRFNTPAEARAWLEKNIDATYSVDSVSRKEGTKNPAAPFTTSTLQQEASRKLHFPVSLTMRIAQALYERGLITYMRTDSTNLSSLALGTAKKFICDNFGEEYSHTRKFQTKTKGAQEAHEAIRPTYMENTDIEGTAQEKKLYSLIWKRTVASQMSEAKVLNTQVSVGSPSFSEKFLISGSEVIFDGFLKLYMEGSDDEGEEAVEGVLPEIKVGATVKAQKIEALCKFSQPPFRYSEATLVKKLEELGIGRPSTYAPTISTLTTSRGYLVKGDKEGTSVEVENFTLKGGKITSPKKKETIGAEKGKLLPQEIGLIVSDYLVSNFTDILDYDFTANIEKEFDRIAEGKAKWNNVISGFYDNFHKKVDDALKEQNFSKVERVIGVDPSDGQTLTARFSQYGAYVQKGDGENKQCASLQKGQLIESISLEEALKLFLLPRTVGEYNGVEVIAMKGRYGPYIKYGDKNFSIPRGSDPLSISIEECIKCIETATDSSARNQVLKEFKDSGISVINGRYGAYIKCNGNNFRIPKGTEAESLSEEDCKAIVASGKSTNGKKRFKRTK